MAFFIILVLVEWMLGSFWGHFETFFRSKVILERPRGTFCDVSRAGAALEALYNFFGGLLLHFLAISGHFWGSKWVVFGDFFERRFERTSRVVFGAF